MARYIIGDIHGKDHWRQVEEVFNPNTDQVYILGDYFDSKTLDGSEISFQEQLNNFYDLCDWASEHEGKIFMLFGNHDTQYLQLDEKNNGWINDEAAKEIAIAFMSFHGMFKFYYITDDNYIISHAGVSTLFVDSIEALALKGEISYSYQKSGGYSPTWIRPNDLVKTALSGYKQIVGHTYTGYLEEYLKDTGHQVDEVLGTMKRSGDIWFVDTVGVDILNIPVEKEEVSGNKTQEKKYDRSAIMRAAHKIKKDQGVSMSIALRRAWADAKHQN
jgi:predicted phosphodiesterase